jgi:hypothetical protein
MEMLPPTVTALVYLGSRSGSSYTHPFQVAKSTGMLPKHSVLPIHLTSFRILPVRREILLGILCCDLIGFHTYDYARHFLSSCTRILGLPTMPNGVEFEGRLAHVGTFPIGIEPASFIDVCSTYAVCYHSLNFFGRT